MRDLSQEPRAAPRLAPYTLPVATYKILSIQEKQKVLGTSTKEALIAWGDFYKQDGRIYDALDFYEKAGATDRVEDLLKTALADGNFFLYRRTTQVLRIEPRPGDLDVLAGRAAMTGFEAYARQARGETIDPLAPDPTQTPAETPSTDPKPRPK